MIKQIEHTHYAVILAYKHEIARWSEIYTDENNKTEIRSAQSIKDFFKTL